MPAQDSWDAGLHRHACRGWCSWTRTWRGTAFSLPGPTWPETLSGASLGLPVPTKPEEALVGLGLRPRIHSARRGCVRVVCGLLGPAQPTAALWGLVLRSTRTHVAGGGPSWCRVQAWDPCSWRGPGGRGSSQKRPCGVGAQTWDSCGWKWP